MNPSDPITRLNAALEGRYRIESELGEGGMAMVYLADDLKHERKVALKVLKSELADVVGAERFLAEIKTAANLTHPHILPLFDSGEANGSVYYVMPYVTESRCGHDWIASSNSRSRMRSGSHVRSPVRSRMRTNTMSSTGT